MERLTKRTSDGQAVMDCKKCKADWTEKHGKSMEECTALYCRNRLKDRVAAYEDTGLTPEELHAYWVFLQDLIGDQKASEALSNFRKLAEADKAGHVVVLPCKVGDTVYALLGRNKCVSECKVKHIGVGNHIDFAAIEPINAHGREYGVSLKGFGKTVFLTHEEVEKALEAKRAQEAKRNG